MRGILSSCLSTWFGGMILALLFIWLGLPALLFVLRCIFWVMKAFQAVTTGSPLPCFYEEECATWLG